MKTKDWRAIGVVFHHTNLAITQYESLDDFVRHRGYAYVSYSVGDHPITHTEFLDYPRFHERPRCYLTDEHGLVIPRWRVMEVAEQFKYYQSPYPAWWRRYRNYTWDAERDFRKAPVPRTGGSRKGVRSYWNHPKTFQEMKANLLDEEALEYGIRIRAKRKHLPTLWDEKLRSHFDDRSWKNFRSHQYMG